MVDCDCTPQVTPWAIDAGLEAKTSQARTAPPIRPPRIPAIEAAARPSKLIVERDASGRIVSLGGV